MNDDASAGRIAGRTASRIDQFWAEGHEDGEQPVGDRGGRPDADRVLFWEGSRRCPAPQLGAACVRALVERTGVPAERVDEVLMGTCIAAGQGMNPARQAAIFGGLPDSVHAATINKACASGLRAVMLADQDPPGDAQNWSSRAAWRA